VYCQAVDLHLLIPPEGIVIVAVSFNEVELGIAYW
jgi:hypothetical protein